MRGPSPPDFSCKRPVVPKHTVHDGGVTFNVETVSPPKAEDARLEALDSAKVAASLAASFYDEKVLTPELECINVEQDGLVFLDGKGLFNAVYNAFARHLPLELAPDDVWSALTYALQRHVSENAEALRERFVAHEGKKALIVDIDTFGPSQGTASQWEQEVFPAFSAQIREHVGDSVHSTIAGRFSTTTAAQQACAEITLMSSMRQYFSYMCRTCSGIPNVTLRGSLEDWSALRARAEALGDLMLPELRDRWLPHLLPVLDEFVASYQGNVSTEFWQSMVKRFPHGVGSGSYTTVSGWIALLYPYLSPSKKKATSFDHLMPWRDMFGAKGPEPSDFPNTMSSTPVTWDYLGTNIRMHFHAGALGTRQDPDTGALSVCHVWAITRDPPASPDARIAALQKELDELRKGASADDQQTQYAISNYVEEIRRVRREARYL